MCATCGLQPRLAREHAVPDAVVDEQLCRKRTFDELDGSAPVKGADVMSEHTTFPAVWSVSEVDGTPGTACDGGWIL